MDFKNLALHFQAIILKTKIYIHIIYQPKYNHYKSKNSLISKN